MNEYINRQAVLDLLWKDGRITTSGIKAIPAADVAPVVYGRWNGIICTHCKLPWNYNMVQDGDDWGYMDPMPDFCPNCGAKMDKEADDAK